MTAGSATRARDIVLLALVLSSLGCTNPNVDSNLSARSVQADFDELERELVSLSASSNGFPVKLVTQRSRESDWVDWLSLEHDCRRLYGYAVSEDRQFAVLRSVGEDGQPGNSDDIVRLLVVGGNAGDETHNAKALENLKDNAIQAGACIVLDVER